MVIFQRIDFLADNTVHIGSNKTIGMVGLGAHSYNIIIRVHIFPR